MTPPRVLALVILVALVPAGLVMVSALALPGHWKAPYVVFGLTAGLAAAAWWRPTTLWRTALGWGAWAGTAVAVIGIALHWGGIGAGWTAAGATTGLLALVAMGQFRPAWRGLPSGRSRSGALVAMAVVGIVVGSLTGGDYLRGRLATGGDDLLERLRHWDRVLGLAADDPLLGIGVGRFAAHFALKGEAADQTGDYRWRASTEGAHDGVLVLTAGRHVLGFGELFRMSQRTPLPVGDITVRWRARIDGPTNFQVEICNKHLLYADGCTSAQVPVAGAARSPAGAGWHDGGVKLRAREAWSRPVFSIAVDTRGARVEIDRIEAVDASGRRIVANGGFEQGLARWFPTSDRHHLPWHAKNLWLHVQVEQGWLGALTFSALIAFACLRLMAGRLRQHELAAPLLAGLVGFGVVGLFDSIIDAPRLAFALFWLVGVAAMMRSPLPKLLPR